MTNQSRLEFLEAAATKGGPNGVARPPNSTPAQERQSAPVAVSRAIHYLGSKLRMRDLINKAVSHVDPHGGDVCDLFSGSGTVAKSLAASRHVTAVDIQEYSRVLCSALLNPAVVKQTSFENLLREARHSEHSRILAWATEPLSYHEADCRVAAEKGDLEPLCDFLENASFLQMQRNGLNGSSPLLRSAMAEMQTRLVSVNLHSSNKSVITRYYGGVYFSYAQAAQLDMLLEVVFQSDPHFRDVLMASLLGTASDIVNTVGKQFAQPIRPKSRKGVVKASLAKRVERDRTVDVFATFESWVNRHATSATNGQEHIVLRADYRDALEHLPKSVRVVYADPPYTRDHYSRYYHVLETMCLRDCPAISTTLVNGVARVSRGIYRAERHQSPFCIKTQARGAFASLISGVRRLDIPLILSYSPFDAESGARPRLMTIADIHALASAAYRTVEVWSADEFSHSKLNRSGLNKEMAYGAEKLIICKP